MREDIIQELGKAFRFILIIIVLSFVSISVLKNPVLWTQNQGYDLKSAIIISVGFAGSFRAMLCCRKKV
ncbi:MAG: hypothetical protein K0R46_483 [Herbinix sp.]|jgi:hypothetical protein|nr:hypothetical protein [Herbinix sp.]